MYSHNYDDYEDFYGVDSCDDLYDDYEYDEESEEDWESCYEDMSREINDR